MYVQREGWISSHASAICAAFLFVFFDYIAILFAECFAFGLRDVYGNLNGTTYLLPDEFVFLWIPIVFIAFLAIMQTYTKMQPILETVRQIFYAILYALIACIL